jgi:hypothetical protein
MAKAKRKRLYTTEAVIPPTPERLARKEVELLDRAIADDEGRPSHPFRAMDTLVQLERQGAIDSAMADAGERFRDDFAIAALEALRAADMTRVPGGSGRGSSLAMNQIDARDRVWSAIIALGGIASPAGCCAWHVLGLQEALADWAVREGWRGKPMDRRRAGGILVGALGVLQAHYGLG